MNNILPHVVMWSNMLMLQRLSIVYGVCVLKRKVVSNKMCTFCYHQRSTPEPSRCKGKGGDVCVCVCMHGRWAHVVLLAWRSGHVKPTPALCVCSCMGLVISVSQTLCQLPQTAHNLYNYVHVYAAAVYWCTADWLHGDG